MALADVRPDAIDLLLRAGTTVTLSLEWPAGSLDSRTFTSTLDDVALDMSVDGDTMTVVASAAITATLTGPADWLLLEDLGGASPEPVLIGTWTPSDLPQAVSDQTVTVTQGTVTVAVSVASAQASLVAHEADQTAHGAVESGSTAIVHTIGNSPVIGPTLLHVSPIPGAVVTVPDLPDPVWLWGKAILDPIAPLPDTLADVEAAQDGLQLSIGAASAVPIPLNAVLDSMHAPVVWNGAGVVCAVELAPNSPGDYQLFATRTAGSLRVLTPSHAQARIAWFRTRPPF